MSDKRVRMKPEARREQILSAAMSLAKEVGYDNLTRDAIAERAGVATGLVNHVFSTMCKLRRAVMRCAVHHEILPIIAQGIANGDLTAREASHELQVRAVMSNVKDDLTGE